jgi:hypothetical protein
MSWQPAPPRPVLYMNASPEAEEPRALLGEYDSQETQL